MPDVPPSPPDAYENQEDQISLFAMINPLLRHRQLIVTCFFLAVAGAYLGSALRTPVYGASVEFVPNPAAAKVVAGSGTDLSLVQQKDPLDYYSRVLVSSAVLDKVLSRSFRGGTSLKDLLEVRADTPERELLLARKRFTGGAVELGTSSRSRNPSSLQVLSLKVRWSEPEMAADLANAFIDELSAYDRQIKSAAARQRREFIEKQIQQTQELLKRAEEQLRDFLNQNRLVALAESLPPGSHVVVPAQLQLTRDRLQREANVQGELYLTLKREYALARIAENDDASPLVIIERASPPPSRTGQSRRVIVLLGGVLGLLVGFGLAMLLEMTARADLETPEAREFVGHLASIRSDLHKLKSALRLGFLSRVADDEKIPPH